MAQAVRVQVPLRALLFNSKEKPLFFESTSLSRWPYPGRSFRDPGAVRFHFAKLPLATLWKSASFLAREACPTFASDFP